MLPNQARMTKPKVYLETSFIGYLTGRLSGDLITAAHQKLTRTWWDEHRHKFELFVSTAVVDALHVAVAAIWGMNYFLTWNCKHIANAERRDGIASVIRKLGYSPAVLCTPEELMGADDAS